MFAFFIKITYDAALGCGFDTIENFAQEGFVMMEIIILPASGTLPIILNEYGTCLLVPDANGANGDLFPLLGNVPLSTGQPLPPEPR